MNFTPGKWKAERGNVGNRHPVFVTAPGKDGILPWCDDDGYLLAAAKDLFYALIPFAEIGAAFEASILAVAKGGRSFTIPNELLAHCRHAHDVLREAVAPQRREL